MTVWKRRRTAAFCSSDCSIQTRPRRLTVGRYLLLLDLKLLTKSWCYSSLSSLLILEVIFDLQTAAVSTLIIISLHSPECGTKAAFLKTNQLISLSGQNFRNKLTFAPFNDCYVTKHSKQHMECTVFNRFKKIGFWYETIAEERR